MIGLARGGHKLFPTGLYDGGVRRLLSRAIHHRMSQRPGLVQECTENSKEAA